MYSAASPLPDQTDRSTSDWQNLDKSHHIHPFTDPKYFDDRGVRIITHGDGCYLWDSDGNKILDGMAGLWCVNIGYGNRELIDVAARQMEILPYCNTFFQTATPPQIELAARIADLTPGDLNHVFFANSGSEANDTVIRLVRHYWKIRGESNRRIFIGRNKGYHGSTLAAVSLGGMQAMQNFDGTVLPDFAHIMEPHWYAHGGDMSVEDFGVAAAQKLEDKILELGPENVAAFIGEPVQGAGGVIDPPMTYWGEIQRICRKYGIVLVADEVICGFGRLGEWFGSQYFGIEPDIICMAKGLSSGYLPISAIAINTDISKTLHEGGAIVHGYTYSGHPVSCAVAQANLNIIEREGLVEKVRQETIPYFRACLNDLADDHPIIGEARGAGLLGALELVQDKSRKTPFAAADGAAMFCRDAALDKGLVMRAVDQAMILCPPLIISKSQIDELIDISRRALDDTALKFGLL
ncbi:MAG: aspartate aminotransferase family protein [Pseudomonadota bacterium]